MQEWEQRLSKHSGLLDRLWALRGWRADALTSLGVGFDGERLTIPIRDQAGELVNCCRYTPSPTGDEPKMLNVPGRPRDMWPAPETIDEGQDIWLVEGEPDAIAAVSLGIPAVAVPGVPYVKRRFDATRFRRFEHVTVVFDCDDQGREAAGRALAALLDAGVRARVLELNADRTDGHDLSDVTRDAVTAGQDGLEHVARTLKSKAEAVPMPYEETPDTGVLLDQIVAFARRFVVLPGDTSYLTVALFVLHGWAFDAASATPYLVGGVSREAIRQDQAARGA